LRVISRTSHSCAIINEYKLKAVTGVVDRPVSEKGERGGSPSTATNGNAIQKDRTRLSSLSRGLNGETK